MEIQNKDQPATPQTAKPTAIDFSADCFILQAVSKALYKAAARLQIETRNTTLGYYNPDGQHGTLMRVLERARAMSRKMLRQYGLEVTFYDTKFKASYKAIDRLLNSINNAKQVPYTTNPEMPNGGGLDENG